MFDNGYVAEGSIRLGILKERPAAGWVVSAVASCRGLDPIGDTESGCDAWGRHYGQGVAEGSIRLGILKDFSPDCVNRGISGCRGLDPIGDTERLRKELAHQYALELQRARSDWGY
mgnify:CR=1 FL=1